MNQSGPGLPARSRWAVVVVASGGDEAAGRAATELARAGYRVAVVAGGERQPEGGLVAVVDDLVADLFPPGQPPAKPPGQPPPQPPGQPPGRSGREP